MKENVYSALYSPIERTIGFNEIEMELPLRKITGFSLKSNKRSDILAAKTRLVATGTSGFAHSCFITSTHISRFHR